MTDLRGLMTALCRDVVLAIIDGFQKFSVLKRNLSTDALKGFKFAEENQQV